MIRESTQFKSALSSGPAGPSQERAKTERLGKLRRIRAGGVPRIVDLFAGCGGLSLGFRLAGFKIVAAVESDDVAAASHGLNFHREVSPEARASYSQARDIVTTEPAALLSELSVEQDSIDVIVGGPPCQAFARVGRAKLREIAEHPEAFLRDPRGNLYLRYLHYVAALQPVALLMENVPDVLNYGGHNIAEEMCEALDELGYSCRYTLLNAAFYGVPQMRERMFLVGVAKEARESPRFAAPSHWLELPRGYEGTRAVALKTLGRNGGQQRALPFEPDSYFVPPPRPSRELPRAVSAEEALRDLPPITLHLEGKLKRGARRFDQLVPYARGVRPTAYGRLMREWPGFESPSGVRDHVIRWLPRDYSIFRALPPGAQYPQAFEIATRLFEKHVKSLARTGDAPRPGSAAFRELKRRMVPPYDPGKFPNKWRKMEADQPARTLMAHLGKDGYSHIHYDSEQARTISVREGARLQSFPDGFVFCGTMNPAFRQIGNAVPPLLAAALAKELLDILRR